MNEQKPSNEPIIQTKRRRGGQPGNKNARRNRGNRFARGTRGNRGVGGAPVGNQYARKRRTLADILAVDYAGCAEASAWLEANQAVLREEEIRSDTALDQAIFLGLPLGE